MDRTAATARRYKLRGPSDPFFTTRLADMQRAADAARQMLQEALQ